MASAPMYASILWDGYKVLTRRFSEVGILYYVHFIAQRNCYVFP